VALEELTQSVQHDLVVVGENDSDRHGVAVDESTGLASEPVQRDERRADRL
jgi:hypothetical protein